MTTAPSDVLGLMAIHVYRAVIVRARSHSNIHRLQNSLYLSSIFSMQK